MAMATNKQPMNVTRQPDAGLGGRVLLVAALSMPAILPRAHEKALWLEQGKSGIMRDARQRVI